MTDGVLRRRPDGAAEAFLPTHTVQSHAANLALLPDGSLGCVWFGGTQEGMADIGIWFSRLPAGGDRFTDPVPLSDDPHRSEQNPVLFVAPDGELWLLHTAQHAGDQDTAVVRVRRSATSGREWTPTEDLISSDEGGVFVRQPPVVLPSGRWLLPTFTCRRVGDRPWTGDHDISSVRCASSWQETLVPESTGLVHMNITPRIGGYVAYFRSRWADHVYRSVCGEDGVSWQPPRPTELPNNNSSIQAVKLDDGRTVMALNASSRRTATARRVSLYDEIDDNGIVEGAGPQVLPVDDTGERTAFWGAPRAPLILAVSHDDGVTWPVRHSLANGDGYALSNNSRDGRNRELSYPSILPDGGGGLHIAFTHHRKAIRYLHLPTVPS
ncbi:exo-alpha-sialidase [Dactylosporangium sp. NPDC005572]|uniref:sialidase family protein n=1 Tax=Dactylosporangium sp. NPDC005572 TaxID=3156889 RepID=UPI0033A1CBF3